MFDVRERSLTRQLQSLEILKEMKPTYKHLLFLVQIIKEKYLFSQNILPISSFIIKTKNNQFSVPFAFILILQKCANDDFNYFRCKQVKKNLHKNIHTEKICFREIMDSAYEILLKNCSLRSETFFENDKKVCTFLYFYHTAIEKYGTSLNIFSYNAYSLKMTPIKIIQGSLSTI